MHPGMTHSASSNFSMRSRDLIRTGRARFLSVSKWQILFLGILCIMGIVGFIVSPYHSKTRLAFFSLGLATYTLIVGFVDSPRRFWQAFGLLILFGLAITLIGAAGTTWTIYKLSAISAIAAYIPHAPAQFLARLGAPDGIHPNQVAGMLTLYLPPLFGLVLFRARAPFTRPMRVLYLVSWIALTIMAFYMALSLSRSGLLATAVAVIFLLWLRNRAWGIAALGAVGLAVFVAYFLLPHTTLAALFSGLLATFNGTGETRTEIWRQAAQAIQNAPLTGIGLYNFRAIFRYNIDLPPDSPFMILHAHNAYLQAALDLGLPGTIAYTLLLINIAWHSFRAGQRLNGAAAGVCYGLAAAILAFGVYGLFDTIPLTSRVAWLTWFSIGLAASTVSALITALNTSPE